ncbi:MAG: hypothetical protein AAF569_06050, partial [Pseudomonadota bacterium]
FGVRQIGTPGTPGYRTEKTPILSVEEAAEQVNAVMGGTLGTDAALIYRTEELLIDTGLLNPYVAARLDIECAPTEEAPQDPETMLLSRHQTGVDGPSPI